MSVELKKVSEEIREILNKKREELQLTFIEDTHKYFMKDFKFVETLKEGNKKFKDFFKL